MGDEDNQQRIIVDQPGMIHVVGKEYLQIWGTDIYVNRTFFKWWTLIVFTFTFIMFHIALGAVLGGEVIISLYNTLWGAVLSFHVVNWFMIPIEAITLTGVVLIAYFDRKKRVTSKDRQKLDELRKQAEAGVI